MAISDILILLAILAGGALMLWPRVAGAPLWRATITPLASIIGSGFLVLGPLLSVSYGLYAPLVMAGLCVLAYAFGAAIRFNIARIGDGATPRSAPEIRLDTVASAALAFAYVISVAYYLNLFGAFALSHLSLPIPGQTRLLTTAVFALILMIGWSRGFTALERLEQISVGLKLAVIAGLLVGLAMYFAAHVRDHDLILTPPEQTGWPAMTLAFGLIVTVQGFETSRYLSDEYDAPMRHRSMILAQGIATAIYMIYIVLMAYVFKPGQIPLSETAIIDLMILVAPILPGLLILAALAAQFSAAVADTSGAGGLFSELTGGRAKPRHGYAVLALAGIALTWSANIFEIISYASRAFALYYGLQCFIAALAARATGAPVRAVLFAMLGGLGLLIVIFGTPVQA